MGGRNKEDSISDRIRFFENKPSYMKPIIAPVDKEILKKELTQERFVRKSNNGSNDIYIINYHNSPEVMKEIARLREITFRAAGGGTGKEIDIDEFDTSHTPYQQLIVWDPVEEEIVGGYRFIRCADAEKDNAGVPHLSTTEILHFSERFMSHYLPFTIELGRSFVQPKYQPGPDNRKGLFSLDNLWDGLGALVIDNPDVKYFFGKVTMYPDYNSKARDLILVFMHYYFPDNENLVTPIVPLTLDCNKEEIEKLFRGLDYKEGHKVLNQHVRALGENIPPLINSYMNLSATMKTFGTAINSHFGDVEETGIIVRIDDIYPTKKERHVATYKK
jgi:hypothetical protein